MIKLFFLTFTFVMHANLFSQSTTKVTFAEKVVLQKSDLKNVPKGLEDFIMSKLKGSSSTSVMFFDDSKNFYFSEVKTKEINSSGTVSRHKNKEYKDVSISTKGSFLKIRKDIISQNITTSVNEKTIKIATVIWKTQKTTKKILNYNCQKATTIFKGHLLTVFFTKEISGKASPKDYPFVDGIVLEYQYRQKSGTAAKVEFNQPDIKDLFNLTKL